MCSHRARRKESLYNTRVPSLLICYEIYTPYRKVKGGNTVDGEISIFSCSYMGSGSPLSYRRFHYNSNCIIIIGGGGQLGGGALALANNKVKGCNIPRGWCNSEGPGGAIPKGWGNSEGVGQFRRGGAIPKGRGNSKGAGQFRRGGAIPIIMARQFQ